MPPLSLLIKPASGRCNLACRYCFYRDVAQHRSRPDYGFMARETATALIYKVLDRAEGACTFSFQGGEPTLAGLDFYRFFVKQVNKYNRKGLRVEYALQTNGVLIDEEWGRFLRENRFLVGLSLDGPEDIHNRYREGSFSDAMRAVQVLRRNRVPVNILSVVTGNSASRVEEIYEFFREQGLWYQQYIPCIDPFEGTDEGYSLSGRQYGEFLKRLFDLWYRDVTRGIPVSIRYFENLMMILQGMQPECCGMTGQCMVQYVAEADGGVYPCDFYVTDRWYLGNIVQQSFPELEDTREKLRFSAQETWGPRCRGCRYFSLCRGGCRRDREAGAGQTGSNRWCEAYRQFFDSALPRLLQLAKLLEQASRKGTGGMSGGVG